MSVAIKERAQSSNRKLSQHKLSNYLTGIEQAASARELENKIQAVYEHGYEGPAWLRISKACIARGRQLCLVSPHAHLIPLIEGEGARKTICVGGKWFSFNSATWMYALQRVVNALRVAGISQRAAYQLFNDALYYPHRCLFTIEQALAGRIPDPVMDVLIPSGKGLPIAYELADNEKRGDYKRLSQSCTVCPDGTLFDWGGGNSSGFTYTCWHCNRCGAKFIEYLSTQRFNEQRAQG